MPLKAVHEKIEEIPEPYRELYTEKHGKYELTGIQGVKTPEDVGRLQRAIDKEKEEHAATKVSLKPWAELGEFEDVTTKLNKYPELEAASKGNLDEEKIDEIANKRAEAIVKSQIGPVERDNNKLKSQVQEFEVEVGTLRGAAEQRSIHDDLRSAMDKHKVKPEFREDVLMWGDRIFELDEEGKAITKEKVGVPPGMRAAEWLEGKADDRPGWFEGSLGTGSRGSGGGGPAFGQNPWSKEHWNMTKQSQVFREKGAEAAKRMAEAAGTKLGGLPPAAKK